MEPVYFTRDEVVIHNQKDDIWVIVNNLVFDLTNLVKMRSETMNDSLRLLIQFAGKDLSWGFNDCGEPLERINQHINSVFVFQPACEAEPACDFWWRSPKYIIGKITCMERRVRIINTITRKIVSMNVCEEDSIQKIQEKYSIRFNRNADSYTWRKTSSHATTSGYLFMDKTLTQNGMLYEKNEKLELPPAIWLFYILNKD